MDAEKSYRTEIKYQCSEAQLAIIQNRLRPLMRTDPYSINGRYLIRSLYFDDRENRCFYENENGTDPREKFRIRIYNADKSRIALECKRKERERTYKSVCLLSEQQYASLVGGKGIGDLSNAPDLLRKFDLQMRTRLFRPVVIVEYERTPFEFPVGSVRITLDRNIRSSNDFSGFFEKRIASRPILPQGQHLLEVKYDYLLPDFLKNALQLGDLQQTAFSKYCLCRKFAMGEAL